MTSGLLSRCLLRLVLSQRKWPAAVTRPGGDDPGELCAHVDSTASPGPGGAPGGVSGGSAPSAGSPRHGWADVRPRHAPGDGGCPRSPAPHDGKRRSRGCFALFAQIGKRSGRTAKPAARCQLALEPGPRAGAENGPGLPSDGRTVRRPDARPTAAARRVPPSPHWHGRSGGARLQKGRAPPNTAPRRAPLPSKAPHAGAPRRAPPARAARQADAGRDLRPPAP